MSEVIHEVLHDAVEVPQEPLLLRGRRPPGTQDPQGLQVGGVVDGRGAVHGGVVVVDQDAAVAQVHGVVPLYGRAWTASTRILYTRTPWGQQKRRGAFLAAALVLALALSSCSINQFAVRTVAGFLAGSGQGTVFTGEDDPELVRRRPAFRHEDLRVPAGGRPRQRPPCAGHGPGVRQATPSRSCRRPPTSFPPTRWISSGPMRLRAKKLFLRGRDYVLRGLDSRAAGLHGCPGQGRAGRGAAPGAARGRRLPVLGGRVLDGGVQRGPVRLCADRHRSARRRAAAAGGRLGQRLRRRGGPRDLHLLLRRRTRGPRRQRGEGARELRRARSRCPGDCAPGRTSRWPRR